MVRINIQLFYFTLLIFVIIRCVNDNDINKSKNKMPMVKKIDNISIELNSQYFLSKYIDSYSFRSDFDSSYSVSYKKKVIGKSGKPSTEEWISFDDKNRPTAMNVLIVKFNNKNGGFEIETNLLSTINYDEHMLLISSDSNIIYLDKVSRFNKVNINNLNIIDKKFDIEFISIVNIEKDSTLAAYSIHKSYNIIGQDQEYIEKKVILNKENIDFTDEKWKAIRQNLAAQ